MVPHKIIAVVEDVDAARNALRWAVQNLLRNGDLITLLHVYPSSRSNNRKKQRRLKGFQLALSFRDLCLVGVPEVKVEIIVTEGDPGAMIVSMVKEIGASALVLGLHDQSFLYKSAAAADANMNSLNCRILAVKQPSTTTSKPRDNSTNIVLSQIEMVRLCQPEPESHSRVCPGRLWMICFRSRRRRGSR